MYIEQRVKYGGRGLRAASPPAYPLAEATIDCLIGKASAEAKTESEVPDLVRLKMIRLYAGVTAQFTLALSDMAALSRELAERSRAVDAEGMNQ
jgi:hypothetical protein